MDIQPAFNSGLQGIGQANQDLSRTAFDIASRGTPVAGSETVATQFGFQNQSLPDLSESVVDLKVAEYQAKSSVNVIKSADEALGTLLDIRV
ncbi:MAG: flagellar biosynthesis protein FlgE [Oceanospirillaceae bacterium]